MSVDSDTSSGDEFEIIHDEENEREIVSLNPVSIYPQPNEYSDAAESLRNIPSALNSINDMTLLNESQNSIDGAKITINSSDTIYDKSINENITANTPVLSNTTGSQFSVVSELEDARKAESTIRSLVGKFEELTKTMESQTTRINELEAEKKARVENEDLLCKHNAESRELINRYNEEIERLKKRIEEQAEFHENESKANAEEALNVRQNNEKELELSRIMIQDLKNQLAAANQCIELWKQNAEKNSTASYGDQKTVIDRLMEENKDLRHKIDEEIARRIDQTEMCKVYESQVNSFVGVQNGSVVNDRGLAYYVELESEVKKLRAELEESRNTINVLKDEANNRNEIVNVLREDQTESIRELTERQQKIDHLKTICSRLGLIHDEL